MDTALETPTSRSAKLRDGPIAFPENSPPKSRSPDIRHVFVHRPGDESPSGPPGRDSRPRRHSPAATDEAAAAEVDPIQTACPYSSSTVDGRRRRTQTAARSHIARRRRATGAAQPGSEGVPASCSLILRVRKVPRDLRCRSTGVRARNSPPATGNTALPTVWIAQEAEKRLQSARSSLASAP